MGEVLLLNLGNLFKLVLPFTLLFFLFLAPWHDDLEDRLALILEVADRGDTVLVEGLRMSLDLEHVVLVVAALSWLVRRGL